MSYAEFLAGKARTHAAAPIPHNGLAPHLRGYQAHVVLWALGKGRCAIFADTGLGKTPMFLEWARHVPGPVLIVTPLAVAEQTIREGEKFGVPVQWAEPDSRPDPGLWIVNYDRVDRHDPAAYAGVVLDEASILKAHDARTRSPPFSSLYTYSQSEKDMGNCRTHDQFFEHFDYLLPELYRVLMPGRVLSFHCMNLPTSKFRDGVIGLSDFRGELIRRFQHAGFVFHSEVVIWKDPVTAMQRTKALGLLHKQLKKDAAMTRQGIPDYLVTMRKPGTNPVPLSNDNDSFPVEAWQRYASPVWMDINPSDTLQFRSARENEDEKHICPLQLGVIRRAVRLWSAPNDVVLSPFAGIGSEGYVCVKMGRRFVGMELKRSYFEQAVRNLAEARAQEELFQGLGLTA